MPHDRAVIAAREALAAAARNFACRPVERAHAAFLALADAATHYADVVRERGIGDGCPLCGRTNDHTHPEGTFDATDDK